MRIFEAKIKWLPKEQGGRQAIPCGDKYAPIISIGKPLSLSDENWSLFVNNKEYLTELETIANVKYLSDNAPNNLSKGVKFELYEGSKLVAHGIIL